MMKIQSKKSSRAIKRALAFGMSLALAMSTLAVAPNADAAKKKVPKLGAKSKTLYYNKAGKKTYTLKVRKNGVKKITKTTWKTSKKSVVAISKKKNTSVKLTAKKAGKATITATVKYTVKGSSEAKTKKLTFKVTSKKAATSTKAPTTAPTAAPTVAPTVAPTAAPTATAEPTKEPTADPTKEPTAEPTKEPTAEPTPAPTAEPLEVTAVNVVTSSKVNVTFSKAVDETVAAANFKISGGASVTGVEFNEDRTVATLVINGLTANKEYTLTVADVTAGESKLDSYEATFTAKADEYALLLDDGIEDGNVLKADGTTSTNVKVSLVNSNGDVVTEADQVELKFDTTAGNFANQTVTVQNGVAENTFTSESLVAPKTALITVTIINAKDSGLLNVTNTMNIVLDPSPAETADDSVGATLTDIKVQTADKVALFFNKTVDVKDYTLQNKLKNYNFYGLDSTKMEIVVTDGATKATVPVIGLSAVEGNDKALYAHLAETPGYAHHLKQLTDNAEVTVKVTDKTKKVPVSATKKAILQDITAPSVLSVTNDGLTKIVLTFSEAVNPIASWANPDAKYPAKPYSASITDNYVIDGVPLSNAVYGATSKADAAPGTFDLYSGADKKNIVTITLGKDKNGKQIYLPAGKHSIQISNVGDAANVTDVNNNKLITQSLDFTIAEDNNKVTAEVEVQSPEQYVVTLNRAIGDAEDAVNTLKANLKLQKWNATTSKYEDVADQAIKVRVGDADADQQVRKFIVEVTKDWTEVYNTATKHTNYYNDQYRLYIAKDTIENPANGKKNDEISMLLDNETMKNPDVTSPEIKDVVLDAAKREFTISLSEPVQVPGKTANLTPNQTQDTVAGIPKPTVAFIKSDNSLTIPATITGVGTYDNTIIVKPSADLPAGTWKVVVYSISDDIGNTAATLVKPDFKVEADVVAEDNTFRPLWVVAVPATKDDPITGDTNATTDVVYVKYSKNISIAGSSANAVSTANYQVNGYAIPVSTKIDVSIANYNADVLDVYGVNGVKDIVAIQLKKGTLADKSNNVYIAPTLESAKGYKIENAGLKTLDKSGDIFTWNYKTVVNGMGTPAPADLSTVAKVKAALADDANVDITTGTITDATAELTINKAMTVDFADSTVKSLTIDTQATGKIVVKNLKATDITVNAPYADVEFEKVVSTGKVDLTNVLKTFELKNGSDHTEFAQLVIESSVTHAITVKGASLATIIRKVNNTAAGTVTFDPLTITTLNQLSAQKLILDGVKVPDLNIKANASLVFDNNASTITNLNIQKGVKLAGYVKNVDVTPANIKKDVTFNENDSVKESTSGSEEDFADVAEIPFAFVSLKGAGQYQKLAEVTYTTQSEGVNGFKINATITTGCAVNVEVNNTTRKTKDSFYGKDPSKEIDVTLSNAVGTEKDVITITVTAATPNEVDSFVLTSVIPYYGSDPKTDLTSIDLKSVPSYEYSSVDQYKTVYRSSVIDSSLTGTLADYSKIVVEYESKASKNLNFGIITPGGYTPFIFRAYGVTPGSGRCEITLDQKGHEGDPNNLAKDLAKDANSVAFQVDTAEDGTTGSFVIKSIKFVKKAE